MSGFCDGMFQVRQWPATGNDKFEGKYVIQLSMHLEPLHVRRSFQFASSRFIELVFDSRSERANLMRQFYFQGGFTMEWTTPAHEEIDLNCEISSYANAEL
jgi:hypothetical protein